MKITNKLPIAAILSGVFSLVSGEPRIFKTSALLDTNKIMVYVKLDDKVEKDQLDKIGKSIRDSFPKFKYTYIYYYLKYSDSSSYAWGYTNFDTVYESYIPEVEIKPVKPVSALKQAPDPRRMALLKRFSKRWVNTILEKEIQIGMTDEMVVESWGKPKKINKSVGSWGIQEQWIYDSTYLYFENGILKSYQTSEEMEN